MPSMKRMQDKVVQKETNLTICQKEKQTICLRVIYTLLLSKTTRVSGIRKQLLKVVFLK